MCSASFERKLTSSEHPPGMLLVLLRHTIACVHGLIGPYAHVGVGLRDDGSISPSGQVGTSSPSHTNHADVNVSNSEGVAPLSLGLQHSHKSPDEYLKALRVRGADGVSLASEYEQWYGDRRELPAPGLTGRELDAWKRFPGPPASFTPKSMDAALADPRGMVLFCYVVCDGGCAVARERTLGM